MPRDELLSNFSKPIWSQSTAKNIDQLTISSGSASGSELMERAGFEIFREVSKRFGPRHQFLVLAGPGNNGGDAFVVARYLHQEGFKVAALLVASGKKLSPDCTLQLAAFTQCNGQTIEYQADWPNQITTQNLVVVDGLLGLGLKGGLKDGPTKDCLSACYDVQPQAVIAIDVPSGMSPDSWQEGQAILPADLTVTFGGKKACHTLTPSRKSCGEVLVKNIGFTPSAIREAFESQPPVLRTVQPRRFLEHCQPWNFLEEDAHKYQRGHLLVLGGSAGKLGAPLLAGIAALRTGAGWVTVATPYPERDSRMPLEMTTEPFFEQGRLDWNKLEDFVTSRKVLSIVIGPGTMSQPFSEPIWEKLQKLQKECQLSMVVDGGALHGLLDLSPSFLPNKTVITPHPGEWTKLSEKFDHTPHGLSDLMDVRNRLADVGITAILKTATPLIIGQGAPSSINIEGADPALAKAGMGDALAGIIGCLGLTPIGARDAALRAQCMIYEQAHFAKERFGPHGIQPTDIIEGLGFL